MRRGWILLAWLGLAGCERRAQPTPDATTTPRASAAIASASPRVSAQRGASSAAPSAKLPRTRPPAEAPPDPPAKLLAALPGSDTRRGAHTPLPAGPIDSAQDRAWVERLASASILEIKQNRGGATLTFKVKFADGQKAAFKPEQRRSDGNFRAEIAAYHLDRWLSLHRTAPVVGRSIRLDELRWQVERAGADAAFEARLDKELVSKDGRVRGALIAWHDKPVRRADPPRDWLSRLADADAGALSPRYAEWSDMVVFDYLIDNDDRWSGGNVLSLGQDGGLIFLDNAAGFVDFRLNQGLSLRKRLEPICRFRKQTIDGLRGYAAAPPGERLSERLAQTLALDPLAPVLSAAHLSAIERRSASVLEHVDNCIREHGQGFVLSL